ncbi:MULTISPECIES: hypothetical protein [Streptomyces]|uniref:hypothetical protein n=1 Tax=Streptomyces TaxID=1883 RepID=UPI0001852B5E|nr:MULTISPECIES: hypothetical protein [Streptomyces]MYT03245.1 hypothetical protein [Streptomyces sp. SID5470]
MLTHLAKLAQVVPALLGLLWLVALASHPIAPCSPSAEHPAQPLLASREPTGFRSGTVTATVPERLRKVPISD